MPLATRSKGEITVQGKTTNIMPAFELPATVIRSGGWIRWILVWPSQVKIYVNSQIQVGTDAETTDLSPGRECTQSKWKFECRFVLHFFIHSELGVHFWFLHVGVYHVIVYLLKRFPCHFSSATADAQRQLTIIGRGKNTVHKIIKQKNKQ